MQEKTLSTIVRRETHSLVILAAAAAAVGMMAGGIRHSGGTPLVLMAATPQEVLDTAGQAYYQGAITLIDLPAQDLAEAMPELSGLEPASDQQPLAALLTRMGHGVEEAYGKFTEVVADEHVTEKECGSSGRLSTTLRRDFSYLIIPHRAPQSVRIEEFRVGRDGKPLPATDSGLNIGEGYAAMWALLYPGNESGSRFRYLGEQQSGGHETYVLGFAQRPGWASVVGYENVGSTGRRVPTLSQGVVWVDKGTDKVLKMRAELLKPRLDVQLEMQSIEIQFGDVQISDAASTTLWVPRRVLVTTVWDGQVLGEEHVYSNYHLPGANSVIAPVPAKPVDSPPGR